VLLLLDNLSHEPRIVAMGHGERLATQFQFPARLKGLDSKRLGVSGQFAPIPVIVAPNQCRLHPRQLIDDLLSPDITTVNIEFGAAVLEQFHPGECRFDPIVGVAENAD
jgi:hypothetical protein